MPSPIRRIPFSDNLLRCLAADLLESLPGAETGDLTAGLILLPSSRACQTLQHVLLEVSERDTLLLPRIVTVAQWSDQVAAMRGEDGEGIPDDRVRPLILARALMELPWLRENPDSAPGLAKEFITFFDEVRLHRREALLLDPAALDRVLEKAAPAEAEIIAGDLGRIHEVWAVYRRLVPRDSVDRLGILAGAVASCGVPGPAPDMVAVAGFGRMDPVRAELLRAAVKHGRDSRLYLPEITDPLSRLFAATWNPEAPGTDPLAPARRVEFMMGGDSPETAGENEAPTLRLRLEESRKEGLPEIRPGFAPCGDPEAESRFVAHRVVKILSGPGGGEQSIAVAVGDPKLADRITAHLRDAGIDTDSTHGRPLSSLPAGLLLRFMLRAALTDLRPEPLLEVLTHPYVQLPVAEGSHGAWTLRLERMFRRNQGPAGGLAGLRRLAEDRDRSARNIFDEPGPGMVEFVAAIADAFSPLFSLGGGGPRSWAETTSAVRKVWNALAPGYPLGESGDRPDVSAAARLLEVLETGGDLLPPLDLGDFSAELGLLLAGENVPAHRARNLPVLVTGNVEARLESFDHLIVAGLNDGIFPARPPRPLLLGGGIRDRLGLPGWREALGRDAELFLRLLHNAPDVLLTWTTEQDGQPVLPSSFVSRLQLALGAGPRDEDEPVHWRREEVPWKDLERAATDFLAEDPAPGALVAARPLTRLSWSALRQWRDCPYRFLLERGFALRKEEEVQEEFGRLEYGSLVHEALADFLTPDGPGYAALAEGNQALAEEILTAAAQERFAPGADDLPLRHLWLASFLRAAGPLVSHELARFETWRPVALEKEFDLPLADLAAWIRTEAAAVDWDPELPALSGHAADILLRGTLDRIDRRQDGTGSLCVVDYKTGRIPSAKKVRELDEMQVLLYAAAVETGCMDIAGSVVEGFYYAVNEDKPGGPKHPHLECAEGEGRLLLLQGAARLVELAVLAGDPAGRFPLIPREAAGEGEAGLPCEFCELRGACRLEERSLPAATERKLDKLVNSKDRF